MTDAELIAMLREIARLIDRSWHSDFRDALIASADRLVKLTAKSPPEGSVQVRIAVAINSGGEWGAYGGDQWDDDQSLAEARSNVPDGCAVESRIVVAYIPPAKVPVVPGVVEELK